VLLFIFSHCSVKKPKEAKIEVGKAVARSEKKMLISELEENRILYSTFNGKAKTKLEVNNKTFNATLNLRIKHQEAIWISVTAFLGIEVARILITPDRIKILNRLQSEYIDKPFDYIYNFTSKELGFNEIEALLIGNTMDLAFNPQVEFYHTSLGYEAQSMNADLGFLMQFGKDFRLSQNRFTQESTNQNLTSNYNDFQIIMNQSIPKNIELIIKANKLDLNAVMDYNNINLNEELSLPFQIPSGFKQKD
jgi:hypothetical protein